MRGPGDAVRVRMTGAEGVLLLLLAVAAVLLLTGKHTLPVQHG